MTAPNMRRRVDAAVRAADHLRPKDQAAVQLARALADAIDQAYSDDPGGAGYKKYLGWVSPNLTNVLRSLGLTPDGNRKAGVADEPKPVVSTLARLRAEREQHSAG